MELNNRECRFDFIMGNGPYPDEFYFYFEESYMAFGQRGDMFLDSFEQ